MVHVWSVQRYLETRQEKMKFSVMMCQLPILSSEKLHEVFEGYTLIVANYCINIDLYYLIIRNITTFVPPYYHFLLAG